MCSIHQKSLLGIARLEMGRKEMARRIGKRGKKRGGVESERKVKEIREEPRETAKREKSYIYSRKLSRMSAKTAGGDRATNLFGGGNTRANKFS